MTLNPDIVFGAPTAVADVKYKLGGSEWNRADLYQLVAFATGFRVQKAAWLGFGRAQDALRHEVRIGDVNVTRLVWDTAAEDPEQAAGQFVADVSQWLGRLAASTS